MTEEIKEILNTFKELTEDYSASSLLDFEEYEIPCIQLKMVLDYITNLQQENERLKEENKHIFSKVNDDELLISNAMNYAEAQDYKSRCEKANKLLKTIYKALPGTYNQLLIEIDNYLQGSDEK